MFIQNPMENTPSKDTNEVWLAAYLYYAEPWEKLLREAVKPFIEEVMSQGKASQYFFIRYWENGPHIRLRFKGNEATLMNEVKPRLVAYFEAYFKANPSNREEPDWLKEADDSLQWYPNDSVQFIEYEPETPRYGGQHGLPIGEEHFMHASEAILEVIAESDEWDYSRALGAGIQLHLGFVYGLEMSFQEGMDFFARVSKAWLPRAYYHWEKDITKEELKRREEEVLQAFETNFNQQAEMLVPFFNTVWNALNEGVEFEQEWLNQWVKDVRSTCHQLKDLQAQKLLDAPQWTKRLDENPTFDAAHRERWSIYESYVHMVNNRLGIQNRDEAYLGYLMRKSFDALKSEYA